MATAEHDRAVAQVLALFHRTDERGTPRYSAEEIDAFVPVLWLAGGAPVPPPHLATQLARFAADVGLRPGMARDDVQARVDAYYEAHPLHPELQRALQQLIRELAVALGQHDASASLQKALGVVTSSRPVGHDPAPPGAIKANPFARFTPWKKAPDER